MITENRELNKSHLDIAVILLFVLPFINGFYNRYLTHHSLIFWILDFFQFIILPSCVAFFLFTRSGLRLKDVGLQNDGWKKLAIHSVLVTIAFYFITKVLFDFFADVYPYHRYPPVFDYGWMVPHDEKWKIISTFYYGLGAGLVEEFYYRGLLVLLFSLHGLKKSLIVLFVSCIFSLIHWESGPPSIVVAFILSLIITTYYLCFRMLWPLVIAHFLFDWIWFYQQT